MSLPASSTLFAPPPGYSGPTFSWAQIVADVEQVSASLHLDPVLALAQTLQESGGNPYAIGDQGTSFGLEQLHQGGELGTLTPQQAFNPVTNLSVSLAEDASVAQQNPGYSPGQVAAAAQRPADQAAYAADVNAIYGDLVAAGFPSSPSGVPGALTGGAGSSLPAGSTGTPATLVANTKNTATASTTSAVDTASATSKASTPRVLAAVDRLLNPGGGILGALNVVDDAKVIIARGAVVLLGLAVGSAGMILLVQSLGASPRGVVEAIGPAAGPAGALAEAVAA